MSIFATEDLTALIGDASEPYRENRYTFDDFVIVHLSYGGTPGDLEAIHYEGRRHETTDWHAARRHCLKLLNEGNKVKLLGRVYC